jgi:exopolyphosphatase/guanosine-5'-triphosphate,3'-diphosphate pyrophosphatase
MLFSSIDIGSNAVRLLLANVFEKNGYAVADKASLIRVPLRLGMDVFNTGSISDERVNSLIKTMKAFSYLLEVYQPIALTICATAAMREAANSADIVKRIKEETNLEVKIIDGLTEARIISQYNSNSLLPDGERTMFVDVGGGSTELSVIENHRFIASESFNIGTIRFLYEKVEDKEWERLKQWLIKFRGNNPNMICMGSIKMTLSFSKICRRPVNRWKN